MLAVILLVGALTACTSAKKTPPEQVAAQAFLDAFGAGKTADAAAKTSDAAAATTTIGTSLAGLGSGAVGTLKVTTLSGRSKTAATAAYSASWKLPSTTTAWKYDGSLPLVKQGDSWVVTWSPADVFPQLAADSHLEAVRVQPTRADLRDSAGTALFTPTEVVVVGIQPALVTDVNALAATLASVLQVSAADIVASVAAAKPTDFVTVVTLRRPAYDLVKDRIHELPGTVFRSETRLLGPSARFAQPLLGSVGPATKEIIDNSGGRIQVGDQVGLSGLQEAYDKQLGGTAGVDIMSVADADSTKTTKLASVTAPVAGTPVQLTLNGAAQQAADDALTAVPEAASVVAVQPSTGRIVAVANSAAATDNIAMNGQFPAGSTFKIATYTALFTTQPALTPATTTDCPGTTTVDGRVFENEDKFAEGTIPISAAFAYSCNTSAINYGIALPSGALAAAAGQLGIGAKWTLPVDAFSGSIPASATGTEAAAEAIGQGKVLVSPLAMALVAGAAATGKAVTPTLTADQAGTAGPAFPADLTAKLNTLMRATVAESFGTAHALASLPGAVEGKTGTAEFGTDVPPKSHSWMVGTRGDLAFAVFVYGGERSSANAVPIAKAFLTAFPA
ncbi:MAG: pbpA [Pseudonocardiales bacterium]|nr:pbpA [Pseudonocardiales bacterium]